MIEHYLAKKRYLLLKKFNIKSKINQQLILSNDAKVIKYLKKYNDLMIGGQPEPPLSDEKLSEVLKEERDSVDQLLKSISSFKVEVKSLENEFKKKIKDNLDTQNEKIKDLRQEIEERETEFNAAKEKFENYRNEIEDKIEKIKSEISEFNKELNEELEDKVSKFKKTLDNEGKKIGKKLRESIESKKSSDSWNRLEEYIG